ncbi:EamA family transporter RarD [Paenibacillus sp. TRM 82003]|nr:EamA family transporter RarD [Paenibacillus sp. TRM 82003]
MTNRGVVYALLAYLSWGLLPLYWKLFQHLSAESVLAHRIVWSFLLVILLLLWNRRLNEWKALFRTRGIFWSAVAASALISINWVTFIHAVNTGHIVESSLGYYINPLVNVLIGVLFLRERPKKLQWIAIGIAAAGVLLLTVSHGKPPWLSLTLAFSFALYGLCKKKTSVDPLLGLYMETLLVLPVAAIYLAWTGQYAEPFETATSVPLLLAGAATALPLLWFAQAAKRLTLTTVGLFQYIAPTLSLLLGVFLYHEPFSAAQRWSFGLIWIALAIYSASSIRSISGRKLALAVSGSEKNVVG